MSVREFLKPERRKIVVSITVSSIFQISSFLISYFQCLFNRKCQVYAPFLPNAIGLLIYILVLSIFIYPFACSIISIYDSRKDLSKLENKLLVAIGLIFFNPFAVPWVLAAIIVLLVKVRWMI